MNTSEERHGLKAAMFINVIDEFGQKNFVQIPDTYLPIEITRHVPARTLLRNADFQAYLGRGMITPISGKKARRILQSEDASEERERLMRRASAGTASAPNVNVPPRGTIPMDRNHPDDRNRTQQEREASAPKISPRVQGAIAKFQEGMITARACRAELRNIKLRRPDLSYIIGNGIYRDRNTGKSDESVADWAFKVLQRRQSRRQVTDSVRDQGVNI